MTIRSADRNLDRGRAAMARAKANGASAMDCAFAALEASFGKAAQIHDDKQQVRRIIRAGVHAHAVKSRYTGRVATLQAMPLSEAIIHVEFAYLVELRECARPHYLPHPRLALIILSEMRLILRWLRYEGLAAEWPQIARDLLDPVPHFALAAE